MGMLRHRPQESNVAVVSLLRNKNGGETLIFNKRRKKKMQFNKEKKIIVDVSGSCEETEEDVLSAEHLDDLAKQPEKFLIFTTGCRTYTPHQIGEYFKL
jgi:hypothetical protein